MPSSAISCTDSAQQVLDEARRLLLEESQALVSLSESLGNSFVQAVEILRCVRGRVIVTGMGKSGHIGAKIAATLASTGTPSFFVHPGEASHGDLGMITQDDAVIAISHSGETKELGDVLAHCGRFNIPLISLTGKASSTLAKTSDVALFDGVEKEACPMNLAPTTSTTATLALGDALAVALMHLKKFRPEDFRQYHPGGKLGSQLSYVTDLMHGGSDMPLVLEDTLMDQAILEMSKKRLGLVGVTDNKGVLVGIVTDGDLRRKLSPEILTCPIGEVMTKNPLTISAQAMATKAVHYMKEKSVTALFVIEEENYKPVGVIHIHDCLKAGVI